MADNCRLKSNGLPQVHHRSSQNRPGPQQIYQQITEFKWSAWRNLFSFRPSTMKGCIIMAPDASLKKSRRKQDDNMENMWHAKNEFLPAIWTFAETFDWGDDKLYTIADYITERQRDIFALWQGKSYSWTTSVWSSSKSAFNIPWYTLPFPLPYPVLVWRPSERRMYDKINIIGFIFEKRLTRE